MNTPNTIESPNCTLFYRGIRPHDATINVTMNPRHYRFAAHTIAQAAEVYLEAHKPGYTPEEHKKLQEELEAHILKLLQHIGNQPARD